MRHALSAAAVAVAAAVAAVPASAAAKVPTGPAGDAFYTPPKPLPGKAHGDLIWARNIQKPARLENAAFNKVVLYRSTGSDGKPIAVSGVVSVPKGKAPKGGWPVVTWAHGTTGIADSCAPSKANGRNAAHVYTSYSYPLLSGWLKRGYAVVRTDYQGLGTPGVHEYLGGTSEGRSTLDIVRAARKLDPRIGKEIAISGHSQGGHAALWAAALAPRWTPELKLRGTVAFAPASHLSEQAEVIPNVSVPVGALGGEISLIIAGADAANPKLGIPSLLSDRALALYPQTDSRCLIDLGKSDSFGGVAPSDFFRDGADLAPIVKAIDASDPENLKLGKAPLLIEQGEDDTTVGPAYSKQLTDELRGRGAKVEYVTFPGADHVTIVTKAAPAHATKWIQRRLK
jgi:pimeloyl-ACP methyl ester carboxylesterase